MVEREMERRDYEQWRQQHAHTSYRHTEIRSLQGRIGLPRHEGLHDHPMFRHRGIGGYEEELPLREAKSTLREASQSCSVLRHHSVRGHEGLPLELATRPIMETEAEYRSGLPPLSGYGKIKGKKDDELPFQGAPQPRKLAEAVKSPPKVINMIDDEGKSTIFSGKLGADHFGMKRKDVPSPIGPSEDTKKHKGEWSCDLCGITATSEIGLKDHLTGKKHEAKQAKVGQKAGKIGLGLISSENVSNPLKPSQDCEKAVSNLSNVGVQKSQQTTIINKAKMECDKKRREGPLVEKKRPNKKKFWCKICGTRAFSESVMNDHMKGKRHLSRVDELMISSKKEAVGTHELDIYVY